MKDSANKIIILVILVIVAVFNIARNLKTSGSGSGIVPGGKNAVRMKLDVSDTARAAKKATFGSWKRSPFIPTEVAAREVPTLALSGIFWDEDRPTAIIDNEIVTVGDKVGETVVVEIGKNTVKLNDGEHDFELTLQE